ncbi:MAG: ferrous iron transport protein A [Phycisphaerae bacterium]
MIKPLAELLPGEYGHVAQIRGEAGLRHRLLEMGLTSGTLVELVRLAPLGDPVELNIRGYRLSVRKSEAAAVIIEAA